MASSRHMGRVLVMQTIFAYEFHGGDPEALLEYLNREFEGNVTDLGFAYELLNGVIKHQDKIREQIVKFAPQWPVDKIAPIDRAILEIGIFEMQDSKDVPPVVAIDEAIEMAKTFGNENSQKFVNGVLNAILKSQQAEPKLG